MTQRRRKILLGVAAAAVALISLAAFVRWPVWLIYNPSESAPGGWYTQRTVHALQPGTLVFARLPAAAAALADGRGYLPRHLPILKHVGAIEGQRVCAENGLVRIERRIVAIARTRDGRGRPLVPWRGCRALAHGEVFLFATRSRASFDSRYFGPVQHEAILGEAVPLWTW
ncbi:S26 family signal peptidase [Pseudoxanthomonas sacheonensis]|uniref:Conjugative transfer signal peptidase TraF n=1 Tax=Pseudoxanthomonas sacheonensis TaxID=443615 RepID=A0ABU1RTS3_9GAMM|nr:S26 family signal peptidase [Pseudoxanthomonas sacheonensis]MDR6841310.1 conjugative transfer signal peptidase TraF [Pseudoxanthomonas sacheonensis]